MKTLLGILAFLVFFPVMGQAGQLLMPPSGNGLYDYRATTVIQDDFVTGTISSGTIGLLGWNVGGGTTSAQASEANRPGILRRDTSTTISTLAFLMLYGSSAAIDSSTEHRVQWTVRLNTNDINTTVRLGSANSSSALLSSHGIYIEKLDGDTNWFCVTRAGGVQTRTDSTIAVSTSFATFTYRRNTSGVEFLINDISVCGLHTTNIPSVFVNPYVVISNSSAASKTIDVDYFEMAIAGLSR